MENYPLFGPPPHQNMKFPDLVSIILEIEEFKRILKDDDSSLTCCSLFMDKRQSTTSRATSVLALSDVYYNALEADSVYYFIAIIFQHSTLIKTEYAAIMYTR